MQKFLRSEENTVYWIGLKKQYPKGIYKWQDGSAPTFMWVSLLSLSVSLDLEDIFLQIPTLSQVSGFG